MDASYADEKVVTNHFEEIALAEAAIDHVAEKKLVRKIDLWIMPLVTLLFLLNFIDRSAVGNANVAGLSKDLKLSAKTYQYNIGLMVFYIFYIVIEPASNLILKRIGAKWLSILAISFGLVTIGSAFQKNYAQFLALRALLGVLEGGAIPGIAFLLSRFYRRHELVLRISIFLALGPSLSGAFGGLLAGALVTNVSIGSVVSWRKIFLVEGIITTSVGIISLFLIADSPERARFLSEDEKRLAISRLAAEQIGNNVTREKSSRQLVMRSFCNINTWLCAIGYALINIPVQGTALFLPTVIKTLGNYSSVEVNLRTVPPYLFATCWSIFIAYMCYRTRRHGVYIAGSVFFSVIGYIIFLSTTNPRVLYFACFLSYTGAVPCGPIYLSWATANAAPETSRAITAAIVPAVGTLGSIAATWAYLPQYAPRYIPGNSLNVGATALSIFVSLTIVAYTKWENKQRELGKRDWRLEGLSNDEANVLGSRHPSFRYLS